MELTGYIGKKVDIKCGDKVFSGYFFEIIEAEDSSIGKDCIDLCLADRYGIVQLALEDIDGISVDERFIEFPTETKAN